MISEEKISKIGGVLNDPRRPLKERFRALFTLKNIGGAIAIKCIADCFSDNSALLKHELAYCLGQMKDPAAIPILTSILSDVKQEPMVRHEAAEALGAIGCELETVLPVLGQFKNDDVPEVKETCQLAVDRLQWISSGGKDGGNIYGSVDPTPSSLNKNVKELESILLDNNVDLYDRYQAMFALRDLGTPECILSLSKGLKTGSALFRHEVAFVLGQLQSPVSVPYLIDGLRDKSLNEMVRHECAEALGAIGTDECMEVLRQFLEDDKVVVKESCEIALDMCDYENSPEFQYANTLLKI